MSFIRTLKAELALEAKVTRNYLAAVPWNDPNWKPHDKSETIGRLAIHVAELLSWWKNVIEEDEHDFIDFQPKVITSREELLTYFDALYIDTIATLDRTKDADLEADWTMKNGQEIYFTLPKKQVLRVFCMNHLIHHRAQLGVYLRILNIPLPATYGPFADDWNVLLTEPVQGRFFEHHVFYSEPHFRHSFHY